MKQEKKYNEDLHSSLVTGYELKEDCWKGGIVTPILQSSIFSHETVDDLRKIMVDEEAGLLYTRGNNPTMRAVEKKLAALEHADEARLFASGAAAMSAAVLANVRAGDHVICVSTAYKWTHHLTGYFLPRFGVESDFVKGMDVGDFERALKPNTRVIILESPSSLFFHMQDLEAIAQLARARGIVTIIDNTWATPLFQNPIDWGIDLVVHSASKYFGGHSDVVAGCVMGSAKHMSRIFHSQLMAHGGIISPINAWLILRGLRTLEVRLRRHEANALEIASFLASHPAVESVIHPCHPSFEQKELVDKYLTGSSGLFSFILAQKRVASIEKFVNSLEIPHIAVSWGGYESLVFPFIANFHDGREKVESRDAIIRLHVGLEPPELLIDDLQKSLSLI